MDNQNFLRLLEERLAKYDLLCHPFYQAWSAGQLTRADLRAYAAEYFHHVEAFPACLADFADRLPGGPTRRAVLSNLADEEGSDSASGGGVPHAQLWLDFAEGMGADREQVRASGPQATAPLLAHFRHAAREASPAATLASFYAYESQVPRIAGEKARGLRQRYGADEKTCAYFTLHATADVHHANVWRGLLARRVKQDPSCAAEALEAAEASAKALWQTLDRIEAARVASPETA